MAVLMTLAMLGNVMLGGDLQNQKESKTETELGMRFGNEKSE